MWSVMTAAQIYNLIKDRWIMETITESMITENEGDLRAKGEKECCRYVDFEPSVRYPKWRSLLCSWICSLKLRQAFKRKNEVINTQMIKSWKQKIKKKAINLLKK